MLATWLADCGMAPEARLIEAAEASVRRLSSATA